jgi:predicted amidophosphoribosyltransferase
MDDHHHYCPVCGQILTSGCPCPNRWCRRPDRGFSVVHAVSTHQGQLRQAIARYKYRGERHLAATFGAAVARFVEDRAPWFEEFDLLASVPAYTGPGSRRSWDAVGAILDETATRLGRRWDVDSGLLDKDGETPGMTGRPWADRQTIARGPLRRSLSLAPGRDVAGASVLVFDDVLTEGSTLAEVARILRRAGACDVAGLVLARPAWEPFRW